MKQLLLFCFSTTENFSGGVFSMFVRRYETSLFGTEMILFFFHLFKTSIKVKIFFWISSKKYLWFSSLQGVGNQFSESF